MHDRWYAEEIDDVLASLRSSEEGLSEDEAHLRRLRYGQNTLPRQRQRGNLELFVDQLRNPLLILLVVAWAISVFLHHYADAAFIGVFVFVNTLVGLYQERKALSALESLRSLITISANVRRDGAKKVIDAAALVPGDVILLTAGDKVPADARMLSGRDVRADESALTGEWLAVSKSAEAVSPHAPLAERSSMLYMGTVIESGAALAVVVATAGATELGLLAAATFSFERRSTPLQGRIAHLARVASLMIMFVIAAILMVGIARGQPLGETFVAALALAVSAIPANLLPAVTLILSIGMTRSLRRNALVRRLAAGETLGSVTVICTDKTGTLTEGKMEVGRVISGYELLEGMVEGENKELEALRAHVLERAVLGTDAFIENPDDDIHEWKVRGRATEAAIVLAALREGLGKRELEASYPLLVRTAFTSSTKCSSSLRKNRNTSFLSVIGAPEIVMKRCTALQHAPRKLPLGSGERKRIVARIEELAGSGLRLVAVASKEYAADHEADERLEREDRLTLLGLIALKDPVRSDARESVLTAERAGVRTVLITGDHPLTALSVAREVGIPDRPEMLIRGDELDALSDELLEERVRDATIFARVSPEHKLRIVRALERRQEIVAMVGDGVNDAPALRAVDIGIAVGSGTDVAKEAADMVLLDNSFHSIVDAIEEGRLMFRNIRKVFAYLIGDDLSELALFFGALLAGLPLPLLPAQILWINIVEDALPVAGIALEEDRSGVMREMPRKRNDPIASRPLRSWLVAIFWITGAAAFLSYFIFLKSTSSVEEARSMIFVLLSLDSLIFSLSVRSFVRPLWRSDIFSNHTLTGAILCGTALTALAVYAPPLEELLGIVALSMPQLLLVGFISGVEIVLIEGYKKLYFGDNASAS